jgi:GH43 family beta-xylosidase/glycerophosphoryl diester phosphodiesterase
VFTDPTRPGHLVGTACAIRASERRRRSPGGHDTPDLPDVRARYRSDDGAQPTAAAPLSEPRSAVRPLQVPLVFALVAASLGIVPVAAGQPAAAAAATQANASTQSTSSTQAAASTRAATTNNPNDFDTRKVMDAITNPKPDLVTISYHRGAHALTDGSYPRVAENSLKALDLAAKSGLEMLELDVKLTSDGVPVLSHDSNWGRETSYINPSEPGGRPFDPFTSQDNAQNAARNPQVASLPWSQTKTLPLRDTISLQTYPDSETVSSLQDALDSMSRNGIAMVLSLDIRDAKTAKAAWAVIANSTDYLGRPYADSTLFKVVAKEFKTPADFKSAFAFGPGYRSVNYWPVYNTGDIAPGVFGSEQAVLDHFRSFRNDGTIKVAATEVQMKQTGGILTGLLKEASKKPSGQPASVTIFSPYADYYAPSDTAKTDPLFFRTNGYCCQRLSEFYYDGRANGQPSDTTDQRGSLDWIDEMDFSSITADRAEDYAARLKAKGLRNISYMQADPPTEPEDPLPAPTPGRTSIRSPDPSVIQSDGKFYSVEMQGGKIVGRIATTLDGLQDASTIPIWSDSSAREVWAPEIVRIDGVFHVYFAAGAGAAHRMYVIRSGSFQTSGGWGAAIKLDLPDDKWAIDGMPFVFNGQRWFIWSGWEGDADGEQSLFIAKMSSPTAVTGSRSIVSQPREKWERVGGGPYVNEGPEAIRDPAGQLHIVYSARHSWQSDYCLAEIRLKIGGDPTKVFDWYKSNGCLFGSDAKSMQQGWAPTLYANGPGHHTFALPDGDINARPLETGKYPNTAKTVYHAVPKGIDYSWGARMQYDGAFTWYDDINYVRCCVAGDVTNSGYSPMFFEDPSFKPNPPPIGPSPVSDRTAVQNADPSVIRQGGVYTSVETDGSAIYVRQETSTRRLDKNGRFEIWRDTENRGEVWAPDLVYTEGRYYIYFSAGRGDAHRMYVISSSSATLGYGSEVKLALADDKFAVDGTTFMRGKQRWFVWSGRAGNANDEQNLYVAKMSSPTSMTVTSICVPGPPTTCRGVYERSIISQPRESWEHVTGGSNGFPTVNEAPQPIIDPNGQLHVVYSANGSWSDQYCLADLRLKSGGDPTKVYDWYKSNGCLFGSNGDTMMRGWDPTLHVDGPGHVSFALVDGDVATSPPAGPTFPMMFHAVDKGTPYSWANRYWNIGSFTWWGNTAYTRGAGNGPTSDTGWSLKFFEGDGPS